MNRKVCFDESNIDRKFKFNEFETSFKYFHYC